MGIKRRDFMKAAAFSTTFLAPAEIVGKDKSGTGNFDDVCGVLVDTVICIGCRKCEWACNQANQQDGRSLEEFEDKSVFDRRRRPTSREFTVVNSIPDPNNPENPKYMKIQCMHCNDPACVSACIVGALAKTEEGPVTYDPWKCMGCRYCMVACPFEAPAYEFDNVLGPRVMKCSFCYKRFNEKDFKPACVEACPNGALTFGIRRDLIEIARARIKGAPQKYIDHIYGEKEAGGTSWMYLAGVDFRRTELPELNQKAIPQLTERIQHGIFKSFVPPVVLYGLLGLIMYTLREKGKKEEVKYE